MADPLKVTAWPLVGVKRTSRYFRVAVACPGCSGSEEASADPSPLPEMTCPPLPVPIAGRSKDWPLLTNVFPRRTLLVELVYVRVDADASGTLEAAR